MSKIIFRSKEEKLSWIFDVHDDNFTETISPDEMKAIVRGLYTMLGVQGIPDEILNDQSKIVLRIIDLNGDGEISKEEFIKNALNCDFICDMVKMMCEGE